MTSSEFMGKMTVLISLIDCALMPLTLFQLYPAPPTAHLQNHLGRICSFLVRAECVRQRNKVAIIVGIIFSS